MTCDFVKRSDRQTQTTLIKFRHGLGDAVQLTAVLAHLKHYHPGWTVDIAAGRGKHTAFTGLCRQTFLHGQQSIDDSTYDAIYTLDWSECRCDQPSWPATKTTRCLVEAFGLTPLPELLHYEINQTYDAQARATATLNEYCHGRRLDDNKFPSVIIHYQGNTSQSRKDLPHDLIREVCKVCHQAGYVPIILDWDGRSPIADNLHTFNPGANHPLWNGDSTGDAETLAALIGASSLMIGVDSGPLHVAGATDTPTIAVWTQHHPVHYFDHADNVLHLVPGDNPTRAAGPNAQKYFEQTYRHQVYKQIFNDLPAATQAFLTGQPFDQIANQRYLNQLTSTAYNERYYAEHQLAGLDYLNFGDWQRQYGRWLTDSLMWANRKVLDVGCACGSILRGLGEAGAIVQGVDVNEHMIHLGREKWPDMAPLLHVCDAVNLHLFADRTWSGLHSAQVAEHWKPALVPHILTELHRITQPDSLFFCALDTTEMFARQGRAIETEDPTHLCIKPMAWWHEQLAATGWDVVDEDYTNWLNNHPESFLKRYDWDWFLAKRRPQPLTT